MKSVGLATHNLHILPLALDIQVAGKRYGVEDGELVYVHVITAGLLHLSEHRDSGIEELHRDYRVFDEVASHELALDVARQLRARHAGYMQFSEHREINVAVRSHRVARHSVAAACIRPDGGSGAAV